MGFPQTTLSRQDFLTPSYQELINPQRAWTLIWHSITDQINTLKSSTTQKDSSKPLEPPTVIQANRRATPLSGGQSIEVSVM